MKLTKLRITNFQSIQDSTEFDIAHVTCLVGKNEAGKTALLKALYRLNPVMESEGAFDAVEDYPRLAVSDYEDDIKTGHAEPAQVVHATYTLERDDIAAVENAFGKNCLSDNDPTVTLQKGYSNQVTFMRLFCVGGPEGSRRGCERHGKSYLTLRRRGEAGDGGGSLTGGAIPSA